MRILSVTYEYPPIGGGGATVAAALNAQFVANGHVVDVVTSGMRGLPHAELSNGVWVHRAPCLRRYRHYTTAPELATTLLPMFWQGEAVIRRNRPELIHAHFAMPSGLVARALSLKYGIPYVVTAHGSDIPGYNPDRFQILHRMLTPIWRRVMRDAAAITSPSQFLANLINRSFRTPIQIVPNGYEPDAHLGREKRNLVLVVARLFPRKGVQHFIDSVSALGADWEMVIAGDGPYLPALKQRARKGNASVHFAGFLPKPELRALYEEARIFVFPSIRENFPMVLLEGMDAGCAVITTNAEGCAEVIGDAGVVIQKGNARALRLALVELMGQHARRDALGALAAERAQQFRWRRIAAQYQEVFEAVVRRGPTRSTALGVPADAADPLSGVTL